MVERLGVSTMGSEPAAGSIPVVLALVATVEVFLPKNFEAGAMIFRISEIREPILIKKQGN